MRYRLPLLLIAFAALAAGVVVGSSGAQRELGPQFATIGERHVFDDPDGGLPWLLQSYERDGRRCIRYGQREEGRFVAHHDIQCPDMPADMVGMSMSVGGLAGRVPPRSVVSGVAGERVQSVTVSGPDGTRTFRFAEGGHGFIAVYAGRLSFRDAAVTWTLDDGSVRSLGGPSPYQVVAPDPGGGPPWTADTTVGHGRREGQTCAQFAREQSRHGRTVPSRPGKVICGDLGRDPFFLSIVEWEAGRPPAPPERARRPGAGEPTHTIVYGVAGPDVARIVVSGPRGERVVPRAERGGAFLLVYEAGEARGRDLTATVRLRDGSEKTYRGPANVNRAPIGPRRERSSRRGSGRRGTCREPGTETVVRTPQGRVFLRAGRVVLACLYTRPRPVVVENPPVQVREPHLVRPFLGYARDLPTGAVEVVVFAVHRGEEESATEARGRVTDVATNRHGTVAWIEDRGDESVVRVRDSRGVRTAASGAIGPRFERLSSSRVWWTRDGRDESAFLKP